MSIPKNTSGSLTNFPLIQGVDTVKGVAMTGGTAEGYIQVLSMFRKDAEERLQKFRYYLYESMMSGSGTFPEKHLSAFITQVHALKSAAGTIGAAEISVEADGLEEAARAGNLVHIQDSLPDFVEHLADLAKNIRAATEPKPEGRGAKSSSSKKGKTDISAYIPALNELIAALKSRQLLEIDACMEGLSDKPVDSATKEKLEQVSDQILMTEFDSAIKSIEELISTTK